MILTLQVLKGPGNSTRFHEFPTRCEEVMQKKKKKSRWLKFLPQDKFIHYKKPHFQVIEMKYQHHQGMFQHTSIYKQQEHREVTDYFFKSSGFYSDKGLNATLLIKAKHWFQIKGAPLLPQHEMLERCKVER